ncbi:2434_t:CDS:1 [Racocetra fulgida]|uniref:2434_t:CDS:1 n=1 Tax=Racocetra fulgida TaxID=60492 RepID=A0A9N8VRM7_9GLOM|nr:2434_t:CDS:1 [Racocetra fulgida]
MNCGVNFPKIKLTNRPCHNQLKSKKRGRPRNSGSNNVSSLPDGHFCLTSFHKYQPRVKMVKHATNINDNDQEIVTSFEETTFIAVTHYQNDAVNSLKKNYNPHAKGFKDMDSKDMNCDQLYYSNDVEISGNESQNEFDDSEFEDSDFECTDDNLRNKIGINSDSYFNSTSSTCVTTSLNLSTSEKSTTTTNNIKPNSTDRSSDEGIRTRQLSIYHSDYRAKIVKPTTYILKEQKQDNETRNWLDLNSNPNIKKPSSKQRPKLDKPILIPSFKLLDPLNQNLTPISPYKTDKQSTATGFPWITKRVDNEYSRDINMTQKQFMLNAFQSKDDLKDDSKDSSKDDSKYDSKYELPQQFKHQNMPRLTFPITPPTPISPNSPINPYLSRLERAENENMKLREFIRERYGIEAEKEADAVVVLGRNS